MCIFCKIANKEIPSTCLYEDEKVMAFLDLSQVTKGHTLVIPKQHYANLLECDDDTLAHVMQVSKKLAKHIMEKTGASGVNFLSNTNEVAGQSVMHFHVHIIPRYGEDDAFVLKFNESQPQDLKALGAELKL